jgi:SAM-dependent methyltransferase
MGCLTLQKELTVDHRLSVDQILQKLRQGQNERLYFEDVIPLFYPGAPLNLKFHSDLKTAFTSAFKEGGASPEESEFRWRGITNIIIEGIDSKMKLSEIESRLLSFYKTFLKPEQTEINQNARATRCFNTVKDHVVGEVVLDYGCGKGLLGAKIQTDLNKKAILVDNIDFNKTTLPLLLSDREGKTSLANNSVDTSIAYLVLHHMDNPLSGLRELARITRNRIILMEGYIEEDSQLYINRSIDWFFNRILLGVDMNVPFNFLKLSQWETLLNEVGFKLIKTEYVGADEKLAPEHHVLMIAERC